MNEINLKKKLGKSEKMNERKFCSNQNRKVINKFNLNNELSCNSPYSSCEGHYGDGTLEKSDRNATATGRHFVSEYDNGSHVALTDAGIVCQCRRNVGLTENQRKREWINGSHYVLENGAEIGKKHQYVAVPERDSDKGGKWNERCPELLLKSPEFDKTGYWHEPYVLIPKYIYCLNQKSRRGREGSEEDDSYQKVVMVDASVETSRTNLKDDGLMEESKKSDTENKGEDGVRDEKTQKDGQLEPSDNMDDKLKVAKLSPQPDDGAEVSEALPPFDKSKVVQEIKYYEGSVNIFGGENKVESPYLKITKTVTFEKERGGNAEKTLGIDSWMQTDTDDSEKESTSSVGAYKNSPKNALGLMPPLNEPLMETAKVCGECVKMLAGRLSQTGNLQNPETGKRDSGRADKSTSIEKRNVPGMEMITNDLVRFIAEVFLEAIPKEMYNRMMGGNERLNNEEYEVRVKSYDRASTESCNLKTCKMRNADGRQVKDLPKSEKPGEGTRNNCICSDPTCNARQRPPPKPKEKLPSQDPKIEKDNTYDCQITLNGKKILVKVNKSVEDLLLSGNIHNVLQLPPDADTNTVNAKPKVQDTKTKMAGNCSCSEEMRSDGRRQAKVQESNVNRGYASQRGTTSGGARRGDSFTVIETGNYQKKAGSDFPGTTTKPLLTSPPVYSTDGRKSDKSRMQDKKTAYNNAKSLFWSNVEVSNKANEDKALKTKKVKCSDSDRVRNRPEYKAYANRRQSCMEEKPKKPQRQSDDCFPLFWESQYLKYCNQIISENGGNAENCNGTLRDGKARNFVHEFEKRMMVAPNFGRCNGMDTSQPLCIIKISDNETCDNPQYRDYTVANVAMKLDSNPFDMTAITCRKCIETLQSCSNWETGESESYRGVNIYDYYCTGTGVNVLPVKDDNSTKSETTLRSCWDECCANQDATWNAGKTIYPEGSSHKLHGICFSVSRVTRQDETGDVPIAKDIGVATCERVNQVETKTSSTQTTRVDRQRSYIQFSVLRRGSKELEDRKKTVQAEDGGQSEEKVQVLMKNEDLTISDDDIAVQTVTRKKFSFRMLSCWRKKDNVKRSSQTAVQID